MSIESAIEVLDARIATLQAQVDPKRPEGNLEAFALIRAQSLGRTFLRSVAQKGGADWREVEGEYKATRVKLLGKAVEDDLELAVAASALSATPEKKK